MVTMTDCMDSPPSHTGLFKETYSITVWLCVRKPIQVGVLIKKCMYAVPADSSVN